MRKVLGLRKVASSGWMNVKHVEIMCRDARGVQILRTLTGLEIRWEQERQGYGYIVEGSTDGVSWFQVSDQRKNSARGLHRLSFPAVTIRHLRLVISSLPQGRWASICEIKAIGGDEK